jgi:uncharacterized protein YecE (DUF72 family)
VRRILIGTASWTDPTLVKDGHFYPPGAKTSEARLKYYASKFPIVEVDSTYYFPPSERNSVLWIERTPKDFTFNVKAYSLLTNHPTKRDSLYAEVKEALPKDVAEKARVYRENLPEELVDQVWQRFHDALMPLHSAGKLGAVLFQFPEWFVIGRKSRDYIVDASRRLEDFRIAVEFRHQSWLNDRNREETLAFLEKHDLPLVCVDMPQGFPSSIPRFAAATTEDLSLVRFHGRDPEVWAKKNVPASERFRYEYSREELSEWVESIEGLARETRETHVLMNNCYRDYAVNNARDLAGLLGVELEREE